MFQPIRGRGGHLVFPISHKNTNLVDDVKILLPAKFFYFCSAVSEKKSNMSQPIRDQCSHRFRIDPRNTDLVEDVEILLPVKFC